MWFDAIIVPRGAEAAVVQRGWTARNTQLLTIAAGANPDLTAIGTDVRTALVMGLCGAVDLSLDVGDVVAYAEVFDGPDRFELDPLLARACADRIGRPAMMAVAVPAVIGDVAAKAAVRAATGAAIVDMEAGSLARALGARGVRVAMVRVVSDDARNELPNLTNVYDRSGRLRPLALTFALARRPARGARFVLDALAALRTLRRTAQILSTSVA